MFLLHNASVCSKSTTTLCVILDSIVNMWLFNNTFSFFTVSMRLFPLYVCYGVYVCLFASSHALSLVRRVHLYTPVLLLRHRLWDLVWNLIHFYLTAHKAPITPHSTSLICKATCSNLWRRRVTLSHRCHHTEMYFISIAKSSSVCELFD